MLRIFLSYVEGETGRLADRAALELGAGSVFVDERLVRNEISTALQRGIPLIPILLNGTKIPSSHRSARYEDLTVRNGL